MFRYSLALLAGLVLSAPGKASWTDGLFDSQGKDFGSVPHGPTLTHYFRIKNNTGAAIHIAGVRVSCGCVTATALQTDLAPGQSTAIQASMDTRRFYGHKNVTIYVQFDRPQWEEARLWVQANSRDDVSVTPETFAFGSVKRGATPSATINVSLMGGGHWQIEEVSRESNYVEVAVQESRRTSGEVAYQLTAKLRADTPVGKWFTDVWLKTNNPSMPKVRVPLTVEIESALSVTPASVALGALKQGEESERKVIVRGVKPFSIKEIKGTDDVLIVRETNSDPKPVHVLTVKLKGKDIGEFNRSLKVITDLAEEGEIEFQAKADVVKKD